MPNFSIILPVYNGGEYVKECVNSILSQTHPDFDLLILDNNSNDGTLSWLQSLNDNRIKIFPSTVTAGIVENWGRIAGIAKNEFMTLIGHDDVLLPHYLQEMNLLLHKHPEASLYQSHFNFIDSAGAHLHTCMPMDEIQHGDEFLACQMSRTMDSMGTGYMMRSKDFDRLGGMPQQYPNLIFADYQLWLQLTLLSYKATSEKICFHYRIHNSTSKLTNGEQYHHALKQYVLFLGDLKNKNQKIKEAVEKYGHDFLMFFCESLSHRILKTPIETRKIRVAGFINECREYAAILIPGQDFSPMRNIKISLAKYLDSSSISRKAFLLIKKILK